jgi:hypothetical protein
MFEISGCQVGNGYVNANSFQGIMKPASLGRRGAGGESVEVDKGAHFYFVAK